MVHDQHRAVGAQRWAPVVGGIAVIVVVGWMACERSSARPAQSDAATSAEDPAEPLDASAAPLDAGIADASELDAGLPSSPAALGDLSGDAGALPSSAPRSVKIGVVLVSFAGAEGAAPGARSRAEALTLAERLSEEAKAGFHQAVTSGDPGSSDDIGRIPRGVLDPRTELAVFTLAAGEISGVLETARGFWIVKRID